jgi:hypothetical protein
VICEIAWNFRRCRPTRCGDSSPPTFQDFVMVADPTVAWLLTALFAATAAAYLYGALGRGQARDVRCAVDDVLHVLMAVAMVVMLWPWGMSVPAMVYVLVFTAAALWFVSRALFPAATTPERHGSPQAAWYHAAMMGSMVFMAAVMSVAMDPTDVGAQPAAADTAMAGMDMAGMSGMDMGGAAGTPGAVPMPDDVWVWVPSLVLAIGFAVAAVRLGGIAYRRRGGAALFGATGGVMAVGMAAVFVQMV